MSMNNTFKVFNMYASFESCRENTKITYFGGHMQFHIVIFVAAGSHGKSIPVQGL